MDKIKFFNGDVYNLEEIYFNRLVINHPDYKGVENYIYVYTASGELVNLTKMDARLLSLMMSGRKGLIDISKIMRGYNPRNSVDYNRYKQLDFSLQRSDLFKLVESGFMVHHGTLATLLMRANVDIQDIGLVS